MAKFYLLHSDYRENGVTYTKQPGGPPVIIDSPFDLEAQFIGKFKRVDGMHSVAPGSDLEIADVDKIPEAEGCDNGKVDITDEFEDAGKAELKVFRCEDGISIYKANDLETPLNEKHLTTPASVHRFITKYVKEQAE